MRNTRRIPDLVGLALALGCTNNPSVTSADGNEGSRGAGGGGPSANRDPGFVFKVPDGGMPATGGRVPGAFQGGITRPCEDLECRQTSCVMGSCKQKACPAGARTKVSGRVYDPAGKVPLYNVVVYVPNAPLASIPTGPSCERCDSPVSGKPIAATLTDTKGEFVLDNVPVGSDVPLVLQIGKWRRAITLPEVTACKDTRIADANLLRMPRNQHEGHLPRIALATGGKDRLECLLRKIGIDETEFTPETGMGRVNFYAGKGSGGQATRAYASTLNGGAAFTPATTFWSQPSNFDNYDIVILSCEGDPYPADKSPMALQGLQDYANKGGRVFASHWHNAWLELGPLPWPQVARFDHQGDPPNPLIGTVDTSFPKGEAFADWLVNVNGSTVRGQLSINEAKHTVGIVNPMTTRQWISTDKPAGVQYFTFNTPVGAAAGMECGRVVFTDIHVSAMDIAGPPYPMGCVTPDLSPQEKALEFMLFDLSSCIQPDSEKPAPPIQ